MNTQRGQVAVLMMLFVPVALLLLVIVADVGLHLVTKLRMQVSADHAVLAASDVLANHMDALARDNHEIHRLFSEQKQNLEKVSQKSHRQSGLADIRKTQKAIDAIRSDMDDRLARGYREACNAAQVAVAKRTPWASMTPLTGELHQNCTGGAPMFRFDDDYYDTEQWAKITFHHTEGSGGFIDPKSVESAEGTLLSYRHKEDGPDQQVAFALRVTSAAPPSFLSHIFPQERVLEASAAAQPFGGSIYEAAFIEDITAVEMPLYDSSLIPLGRLQDRDSGYRGLVREVGGYWEEDHDVYWH